jgi:hypothetical protein
MKRRDFLKCVAAVPFIPAISSIPAFPALERIEAIPGYFSTGFPTIDEALGGGLRQGTINLIVGKPWSGKTGIINRISLANPRMGKTLFGNMENTGCSDLLCLSPTYNPSLSQKIWRLFNLPRKEPASKLDAIFFKSKIFMEFERLAYDYDACLVMTKQAPRRMDLPGSMSPPIAPLYALYQSSVVMVARRLFSGNVGGSGSRIDITKTNYGVPWSCQIEFKREFGRTVAREVS